LKLEVYLAPLWATFFLGIHAITRREDLAVVTEDDANVSADIVEEAREKKYVYENMAKEKNPEECRR
jgi:hypothetical protein